MSFSNDVFLSVTICYIMNCFPITYVLYFFIQEQLQWTGVVVVLFFLGLVLRALESQLSMFSYGTLQTARSLRNDLLWLPFYTSLSAGL